MKKFLRMAIVSLLSCLMLVSLFAFAACNEKPVDNDADAFTVIVLKPDGTPYKDIQVGLCIPVGSTDGGACAMPVTTDADGKAVVKPNFENDVLDVHLLNLPAGQYTYDNETNFVTAKRGETTTVTLKEAA